MCQMKVKMSENQKRSALINQEQKHILTDFLQSHGELLSGKFSNEFTKKTGQKLWEEISCSLNAVPGGAKKTWTQWRKTWQDIKKNVKSKTVAEKRYAEGTGGGPLKVIKFDDTETKIISLISPKVTFGDISVPVPNDQFDFSYGKTDNIALGTEVTSFSNEDQDLHVETQSLANILTEGEIEVEHNTIRLHYPDPNSVEINPDELWIDIIEVIKDAVEGANISIKEVKSLAISTQRGSFITWRKDDQKPIHNFITWKDLRAAKLIEQINKSWKMSVTVRLLWQLQNNEEVQRALAESNLMFGTLDTWLIYKLTGGKTYVTDVTNASATGLYDPFDLCWSFIPKFFNIPLDILPTVVDNDYNFGETLDDIFGVPIKIGAVMADQSASMYGSCSFKKGDTKLTLGTGAFLNINTGQSIQGCSNGMYPLVGWKNRKELIYFIEVACLDAGSLIQWMMSIGLISSPEELSSITSSINNNGGVYFVPAFSGLGPPINNESAASGFIGVKPSTNKEQMIRAVLESIVYRTALAYSLLNKFCENSSQYIRVNGGVARNDFICQLLADLTNRTVRRTKSEMSTLGVVYLAGQSCGFWKSTEEILSISKKEDIFKPTEDQAIIKKIHLDLQLWQKAAERFISWYN